MEVKEKMLKRLVSRLARLKAKVAFRALQLRIIPIRIFDSFNIKSIISLCVYIAVIPIINDLLSSLSTTLTGTAGTLLSAIIGLVPLILVMKVLDKLNL